MGPIVIIIGIALAYVIMFFFNGDHSDDNSSNSNSNSACSKRKLNSPGLIAKLHDTVYLIYIYALASAGGKKGNVFDDEIREQFQNLKELIDAGVDVNAGYSINRDIYINMPNMEQYIPVSYTYRGTYSTIRIAVSGGAPLMGGIGGAIAYCGSFVCRNNQGLKILYDLLKVLVDAGANVNDIFNEEYYYKDNGHVGCSMDTRPLCLSADISKLLLDNLHYQVVEVLEESLIRFRPKDRDNVKVIIDYCARCELKSVLRTLLYYYIDDIELVKYLIAAGVEVNGERYGEMPLINAILRENNFATVKLLCESGAKVDCCSHYGNRKTALMYAVEKDDKRVVTLLLEQGAKISQRDKKGQDVYDYVQNMSMLKLLDSYAK